MLKKIIVAFAALGWTLMCGGGVQAGEEAIRFAFQDRIGSVIPIVAVSKGFFAEQGLTVTPLRFSSGPACAEALYSGAADVGAMGDTTAIIAVSRSQRFAIVASYAVGEHRHRVMVRQDSPYAGLADLQGKRLAVKKGTSTYGGLLAALKKQGMTIEAIQVVDLSPSVMNDALAAGSIDAFAASEPTPSLAEGKATRQLATFGGLGNEYPIMMLADRGFLNEHATAMKKFFKALRRAALFAAQNPDQVVEIMAAETGLSADAAEKAMQRHQYALRLDAGIRRSLAEIAVFLREQKVIEQVPDLDAVCDGNYLEAKEN